MSQKETQVDGSICSFSIPGCFGYPVLPPQPNLPSKIFRFQERQPPVIEMLMDELKRPYFWNHSTGTRNLDLPTNFFEHVFFKVFYGFLLAFF